MESNLNNFLQKAKDLLTGLETQSLEVILVDAPEPNFEGHKIRLAVNRNPQWYSNYYYSRHATPQKSEFLKALRNIANGIFKDLAYYNEITDLILDQIKNEQSNNIYKQTA